jgi:hypothetical protein
LGVGATTVQLTSSALNDAEAYATNYGFKVRSSGSKEGISGEIQTFTMPSFTTGDVIGIAVDADNGAIYVSKNGTYVNSGSPTSGASKTGSCYNYTPSSSRPIAPMYGAYINDVGAANFGQRPFAYTPPSGFVRLNTFNLPTPTIGATASTTANKYFDATLYTGNGSTQSITNAGSFQPDFVWIKSRSPNGYQHVLQDVIRGTGQTKKLYSSLAEEENGANAPFGHLSSFDSNGFSVSIGSTNANQTNASSQTYVGWQWKANGAGVSNTAGDIASVVSANTSAGFSIVTWTGNGSNRPRIGHGLGVAPSVIIEKGRDVGTGPFSWVVQHKSLTSWNNSLFLNNDSIENSGSGGGTAPTDTVYYAAANNYAGESGVRYVAYCFAPVAGYSAFGSYTGNGADDGVFVFTGFKPRYIVIKRSSSGITAGWITYDTARSTYNVNGNVLEAQDGGTEGVNVSTRYIDILSNGFKLRTSASALNGGSGVYVYMAFAEHPFKYANAR